MDSTALATEMTSAVRFGTGVETQRRALGASVRHRVLAAGVGGPSRARITRDIQVPTTHVLGLIAFALRVSSSVLDSAARDLESDVRARGEYALVDKHLTRC